MVAQGDLYWSDLPEPRGSEAGYPRPVVVVQNNGLNASRIQTVVVCPLSSAVRGPLRRTEVRVPSGEANLPKESVIIATQVFTLDKRLLGDFIGQLPPHRLRQALRALALVLTFTPDDL